MLVLFVRWWMSGEKIRDHKFIFYAETLLFEVFKVDILDPVYRVSK